MTLTAGARLGAYQILSALGAGGMGEVYRAHDTRLNRDVAIKVLPELFALDPDRLARFRREAQLYVRTLDELEPKRQEIQCRFDRCSYRRMARGPASTTRPTERSRRSRRPAARRSRSARFAAP